MTEKGKRMDMIKKIKDNWNHIKVETKTVREFGFILTGFLLIAPVIAKLIGVIFMKKPFEYWLGWPVLSVIALAINLAVFPVMTFIFRLAMFVAEKISWVLMRIVLAMMFYGMMTPVSLVMRLFGKDLLDEKIDRSAKSYWKPRDVKFSCEKYEHLY